MPCQGGWTVQAHPNHVACHPQAVTVDADDDTEGAE